MPKKNPKPKSTSASASRRAQGAPSRARRQGGGEGGLSSRPLREDLVLQASLEAYALIRHEGRLADRALELVLRHKKHLYSTERRAVAERVYALLRRQLTVDHLLLRVRRGFEALPKGRQDVLRLSASRVLHGEDPDAVARGGNLAAEDAIPLRALEAARAELATLEPRRRFELTASMPPFLAERFQAELGEEALAAAEAMNERAPLTARVNTLKLPREKLQEALAQEDVTAHPTPLSPLGLTLDTRSNAFALEAFQEGLFELQDEGSQLLGMLVDAPPKKVVDACAGAGGKTLQLAAQMKNRGELFALDVDEGRIEELRRRARRAGAWNVRTRVIPPGGAAADEAVADLVDVADRVLVDAPCSGTGTFRRKPDARYRFQPESLAMHVDRQQELLSRFCRLVKPGGRLIYGTCSILREENEDVVAAFLATHPEFSVRPIGAELGPGVAEQVTREGFLRLYPHRHGTDGFFGAVLERRRG